MPRTIYLLSMGSGAVAPAPLSSEKRTSVISSSPCLHLKRLGAPQSTEAAFLHGGGTLVRAGGPRVLRRNAQNKKRRNSPQIREAVKMVGGFIHHASHPSSSERRYRGRVCPATAADTAHVIPQRCCRVFDHLETIVSVRYVHGIVRHHCIAVARKKGGEARGD